ncbi:MAG: asparagine synthase-related protein [Patescibacteria group bacterium]
MCGIAAIFGEVNNKEEKLKASLSKITHRGEYSFEYKVFDHAALGANRLAIVDEKLGMQPQQDKNGDIFAIQSGEIFNFVNLAQKLQSLGHTLRTHNDTEVLVHLWKEYKEKTVLKLDSEMFAFVIYDKKSNEIFVARDRIGVKPLYYAFDEHKNFYLASEMKALVCLEDVKKIHEFPPGHYFYKNKFVRYFGSTTIDNKNAEEKTVQKIIEESVAKRVQTDLPIAVFLSGGVDSSLIMELATRLHRNVTALILGKTDSPDYISAVRLCKEKQWKYRVIEPKINYEHELANIVYFVETYDPNIVRHSFANDIISKFAHRLGFKIVLTGEGADEIFAGYNEFLDINKSKINLGCKMLLESMSRGNLMRIDKMAMRYTVETRCPFFDQKLVDIAMPLDSSQKVGEYNGKQYTKLILRKIALKYLPEYIALRDKFAFANGAGMNIGMNYKRGDGVLSEIAARKISDSTFVEIQRDYSEYKLETKEEVMLFDYYRSFGYDKFIEGKERLIVKDTLYTI